ncbi:hypothetical protein DAEQUDRAFT_156728 [Daedalea quercina L-15889]|uniref:Uncharacterized protein n=1 Tax=Daedalea quercina L-15889 TaxID=1314783 RepID=A0A165RQ25_9APHY|nr:hypothetical protein DAEQUDRAFT_156728 [Daedalea quercina L-15889]
MAFVQSVKELDVSARLLCVSNGPRSCPRIFGPYCRTVVDVDDDKNHLQDSAAIVVLQVAISAA